MDTHALDKVASFPVETLKILIVPFGMILVSIVIGVFLAIICLFILRKLDERINPDRTISLINTKRLRAPLLCLFPALCVVLVLPTLALPIRLAIVLRHGISLCTILAVTFLCIRIVAICIDGFLARYDVGVKDNLKARAVHTQFRVIERILVFGIIVITFSSILMTFDKVKQIGMSLLASAGVVGVILGFAAQRSIATVFAGIQIALTQPIRGDDVVIVEGEWGRIEEITLTYVVVKIWDLRRLVLPVTYFIEKPFQNWTRTSADILGTVFIYSDYRIDVEPLRKELKRILDGHPLWDGKVSSIQVTGATENSVEIRALMSSEDASKNWDLRCNVREKLISFIREQAPDSLPRMRVELDRKTSD